MKEKVPMQKSEVRTTGQKTNSTSPMAEVSPGSLKKWIFLVRYAALIMSITWTNLIDSHR